MSVDADPVYVSELGEFGLIERINSLLSDPPPDETWAGDDAAVLRPSPSALLYTTDAMVELVDFDLSYCLGADVGWKAIAINASDVAAMGGTPRYAVAALALPPDALVSTIDGIAQGMRSASARWEVDLVGGDVTRAQEVAVTVAMIGAAPAAPIHRSGAAVGDAICVTGSLGAAAGGLIVLRRGLAGPSITEGRSFAPGLAHAFKVLAACHLRPQARVSEGRSLAAAGASSMIDVSDGLAADLARLMEASGNGCAVDPERIPINQSVHSLADAITDEEIDPLTLALTGGEDFELLFTIGEERLDKTRSALAEHGTPVTTIGAVTEGARRVGERDLDEWKAAGWDHLLNP